MSEPRDGHVSRHVLPVRLPASTGTAALDRGKQASRFAPQRPISAPEGAPNVLVVLLDDMGFGASSAFGGPIDMPAAERLSQGGLRYTRFHTAAICAPTRASLLTGRNPHAVGFGTIPDLATASPGYNCVRPPSAATLARILKENGYCTGAFGKMHQTPGHEATPFGPFDRWPTAEGFERFYGFLGGETDQYYPGLVDGTIPISPPRTPEEGYHLSEDLADQLIQWVEGQQALTTGKPFFAYLSFGATHAPLQVPREWIEKYRGRFDHGWDRQREITLKRQQETGVVPDDAELAPWAPGLPHWDEITEPQRQAAALLMELYAGFAEHTDAQVGRVVDALETTRLIENTLIFYILGDNGASSEGGVVGTSERLMDNGFEDTAERILESAHELGGPRSHAHYPASWALAMDTPYQWVKQMASHYGGTRNPLIVHWPERLKRGGELRHQWHHVCDVMPTILEAAGLPAPVSVDGVDQRPMDGASMAYTFDDADAPDRHVTQYFEAFGNRGIYHDGWVACATHRIPWEMARSDWPDFDDDVWELYDTNADWTQARDLAQAMPEKLEELKQLFLVEAARNQVFPLDDRFSENFLPDVAGRLDVAAGRTSITYPGSLPWLSEDAVISVRNRSHVITALVELEEEGRSCVIATQGGPLGGWSLYLRDGKPAYCNNVVGRHLSHVRSDDILTAGTHEIRMEFDHDDGGGFGRGGTARLLVDGEPVGKGRVDQTTPFNFGGYFTVGHVHGAPVTDDHPAGDASRFAGEVAWVRIDVSDADPADRVEDKFRTATTSH